MIRKYLIWGLTFVLIAAAIALGIRGRRLEKQQAAQVVEVVKESETTATRSWAPRDVEIVLSKMLLEKAAEKKQPLTAQHHIELRNNGQVLYDRIQLKIEYLDSRAKVLETRLHSVEQIIPQGTVIKLDNIKIDKVPASTEDCRVAVVYADVKPATPSQNQGH
jgi:hypothetical protein